MRGGRSLALLASLFVAALALRPQLVGLGPLIPEIQDDLDVSHAVAGLLGTIPVLCMGLFAPPGALLSDRVGPRSAVALCLTGIALFGLARAVAPGAASVLVLTFGMSIGLGAAQAVMPVAVKEDFPHRPGFATGVYALGMYVGAAVSTAVAVPVAEAAGGWRWTLAIFSIAGIASVAAWLLLTRRSPPHRRSGAGPPRLPWRSSLAWRLVGIFGLMAGTYYAVNAWIPDVYVERGWSEGEAGSLLAVASVCGLVTALLVPWLTDRRGSRRPLLTAVALLQLVGLAGFLLAPGAAWLWAVAFGLASGGLFPVVMTLPLDAAQLPADVGAVAAMMMFGGYLIGASAPLGLGAVRDATGSYTAPLWLVAAGGAGLVVLVATLSPARLRAGTAGLSGAP